jgi:hypothetical protein
MPDQPTLRLPPGVYRMRADLPNLRHHGQSTHGRGASDSVRVVVAAEGATPTVILQLVPKAGLRGRVTFAEGDPLGTIRVHALRVDAGEEPDVQMLLDEGETKWIFASGTYEFDEEDIGVGRFLVGVAFHETVVASRVVEIGRGPTECDFHIEELPRREFVAVEVRGPGGEPVEDLAVFAGVDDDGDVATDDDSGFRLRDGGLLVAHYTSDPDVRLFVEVSSKRFGSKRAYYERDQLQPVRIAFGAPGRLAVTLRGYAGSGHEGWLRAALAPSDRSAAAIEELGDYSYAFREDGTLELGPAQTGSYLLVVYVGIHGQNYEAARHDVRLRAGENRLAIAMPAMHRLVVRAPGLEPGTVLELIPARAETWLGVDRRVGEDRRVVFPRLPTGRYRLMKEGAWGTAMVFELPHAGEVLFEARKPVYNAMRVWVNDRDGQLAKAGFEDDDLVVGIGGTEFSSQRQMQLLMVQAAARPGTTTLLVERRGRRLELEADLQALVTAGADLGGGQTPASR